MQSVGIDAEQLAALRTDGAIRLKKPFDDMWLDRLRDGIERNILEPSPLFKGTIGDEDSRGYLFDMWTRQRIPEFDEFLRHSGIAELAAKCLGQPRARLMLDAWFSKPAGTIERTPWHQDIGILGTYYSFWVALDPIPRSESLELIRGSHLLDSCFMFEQYFNTDKGARTLREMEEACRDYQKRGAVHSDAAGRLRFLPMPDIEATRQDYDVLSWDMDEGDCIIFHGMMLHSSSGNPSRADARRFVSRWAETSAVVGPHGDVLKGAVSRTGYDIPLTLGEPFTGQMFPVLPDQPASPESQRSGPAQ
ncbi:MAG: phytanoyl-CoA dioxygenase family protein [Pseudomonadota bacterium]